MRVIYIDIDSLRPDHLGCYGYHRDTSPNIDRIAADSVVFSNAYVSSSPCMPSRGSLISGQFGIKHGVLTHFGEGSAFRFPGLGHKYFEQAPTLTRYLRQNGYKTVSFSSFMDRHLAFWFGAGWSEMHTHTLKQGNEDADEVNAAVIPWLRNNAAKHEDMFLHVQYWDPHRDYTVEQKWVDAVDGNPVPSWISDEILEGHHEKAGPFTARELFPANPANSSPVAVMPDQIRNLDDVGRFISGYDGAIRFLDNQIGELLEVLDDLGILDETAIILSADHGESLGEGGVYGDHVNASESVHNVPLIIKWPGAPAASRQGLLYQLDLLPTLCDLLGLEIPEGWDGRSFQSGVTGEQDWGGRDWLVWDHALYSCQRVVRTPEWLFQRTYHPGLYDFEDIGLFDMVADRHQRWNRAEEHPNTVGRLRERLHEWRHLQLGQGAGPDPMEEILSSGGPFRYFSADRWSRRLREHGRNKDAEQLMRSIEMYGDVKNISE